MPEDQNIEYKSSWHDDWLKIICGFANGKLQTGKDDNGNIVALANSTLLTEDIPNNIKNHLGIIAETNLIDEPLNNFIEVVVPEYSVVILNPKI